MNQFAANINLDLAQEDAFNLLVDRELGGTLMGYAGTGKTTVVGAALQQYEPLEALLLAPTNKAARLLGQATGRPASTIHRATMRPEERVDKDGNPYLAFVEAEDIELSYVKKLIIDEASMIGERTWATAMRAIRHSFDKAKLPVPPIVLVGDGFQLPPVQDDGIFATFPGKRVELTKVYRQAEGSEVLDFATDLRSMDPSQWRSVNIRRKFSKVSTTDRAWLSASLAGAAVALVHSNAYRITINADMREAMFGSSMTPPKTGERLVAYASYRGDSAPKVLNGAQGQVMRDAEVDIDGSWKTLVSLDGEEPKVHHIQPRLVYEPYQSNTWNRANMEGADYDEIGSPLTFGYAMTVHKSQGSQWPIVAIEPRTIVDEDVARWTYTGVTRAQQEVYVL